MKIYRVELEDGTGPYQMDYDTALREAALDLPTYLEQDEDRHPHPALDGFRDVELYPSAYQYEIPREMSFGFSETYMLDNWFFLMDDDAEILEAMGLIVRVYEVDEEHTQHGFSQSMFRKDHAERVAEYRPTVYANLKS